MEEEITNSYRVLQVKHIASPVSLDRRVGSKIYLPAKSTLVDIFFDLVVIHIYPFRPLLTGCKARLYCFLSVDVQASAIVRLLTTIADVIIKNLVYFAWMKKLELRTIRFSSKSYKSARRSIWVGQCVSRGGRG